MIPLDGATHIPELEGTTQIPFDLDPPTPAQQLAEYVVMRGNRGDDVASILAGALEVFGEEPEDYVGRHARLAPGEARFGVITMTGVSAMVGGVL